MTTRMETVDGGTIDAGFWGPDVSRIQLGELPMITTQQFVGYAALALTEGIIPKLDTAKRVEWARDARSLRERVQDLPILRVVGKFFAQDTDELLSQLDTVDDADKGELHAALSAAAVPTEQAVYYAQSPFKVQTDGQQVGFVHEDEVRHVVKSEDFFNLTHNVIDGGLMGWGVNGTYQEVKDAAVQIDTALNS